MTGNAALAPFLIFVGTPLYNYFIFDDATNLPKSTEKAFENSKMFAIPLWTVVFWCVCVWLYGLALFSGYYKDSPFFHHVPETAWQMFTFFVSVSFFASLAQANGHELVHKKETHHKFVGAIPYFLCCYSHFGPEHVKGHHRFIATDDDPVSTDKGFSFYQHIVKAVVGTHITSWNREIERINRHNQSDKPGKQHWLLNNAMTFYFCLHVGLWIFVYQFAGMGGINFQIRYTCAGLFWAEAINYIEHYGLRRKKVDGEYEAVDGWASWNAPASTLAAKIQRHSDHHTHAYRPY